MKANDSVYQQPGNRSLPIENQYQQIQSMFGVQNIGLLKQVFEDVKQMK